LTPTPPPAPPAPGTAAAPAVAPSAPAKQPLEYRFPRLYYDFETVTTGAKTEDVMVAKTVPPTLADVVRAVCASHGTADQGLISDLHLSIAEFLGEEAVKQRATVKS
jgi:hypothetical protein